MSFGQQPMASGNIIQLAVKGWASPPSKFASDPESGVSAIVKFLERKSERKIHASKSVGRTHILIIDIDEADAPRFHHLNGFTFSGSTLTVEAARQPSHPQHNGTHPPTGPRSDHNRFSNSRFPNNAPSGPQSLANRIQAPPTGPRSNTRTFGQSHTDQMNGFHGGHQQQQEPNSQELQAILIEIIRERYNAQEKYLTFESLSTDQRIQASGLSTYPPTKVFSALFICCEKVFETPAKRKDMVVSVSLRGNNLRTVQPVIALSATFPQLKNLDLSNNQLGDVGDIRFWRNSFRSLEHLIISDNPIDSKPQEKQKLARWYRSMKMMNGEPIQPNAMTLDSANDINRAPSPAQALPTQSHPEFPEGSTFGLPQPGKSEEVLLKEQMGLRFSFETRLKMSWVEQCLGANNFDYDKAMLNLQQLVEAGEVPADAFLNV
jgi:hypothetical protein